MSDATLKRLAALLREEGGLLGEAVREPDGAAAALGEAAATGPRCAAAPAEYALIVEAVREGYLLHYGGARVISTDDPDLALLAGDRLYALGLERLADLGDMAAVVELAETIGLCAIAHGAGDAPLAEAVWAAGARAVGWGTSEAHREAKRLAGELAPGARDALIAVA